MLHTRASTKQKILLKYIKIGGKLAFLCLQLLFDTTPQPEEYTTISEAEIYLSNDLLMETSWDATYLQSTHKHVFPGE